MFDHPSLPPLTATIFALIGLVSENVQSVPENKRLHRSVSHDTLRFPPRSETLVPIHSDDIPFTGHEVRGVHWGDADIPGSRTLYAYDDRGNVALELHMPSEYADAASVQLAWTWLNAHCPKPADAEQRPQPTAYPPLRLI